MAEPMDTGPAIPRSGFLGKITSWVKRNKMVAALFAGGAALFLIKKGSGEGGASIINPEGEDEGASSVQLVPVSVAPSSAEGREEEPYPEEEPLPKEPVEVPAVEEKEEPAGPEPVDPPEANEPGPVTTGHGVTIHGREFPAATSFKLVRQGKDQKGTYSEYLIQFEGFTQRWHYYATSNSWAKVGDSREGGGSKPPTGTPEKKPVGGPVKNPPGGSPGSGIPNTDPAHPNAVRTDHKCSEIGKLVAPKGYHYYCGPGNYVWRAPDATKVGPGKPISGPGSPAPAPAPAPSCPAGTVANIQQNRAEVQRLTGEIQDLKARKPKGWAANVAGKEQRRNECQGAVDRGRQQPGCGNV